MSNLGNSGFSQREFDDFVLRHGVIGFFQEPIKLKSGRMSNWYVNWRTVSEDAYLLDRLTDFAIRFIHSRSIVPASIYGVPEGATKTAVIAQHKLAKDFLDYAPGRYVVPMGRGKPKEHGAPKDRFFLGMPRGKTLVLEDVTTTGGSLLGTIDVLAEAGVPVIGAMGLTDRNEVGEDGLSVGMRTSAKGVPYHAMSNALDLLPKAYKMIKPGVEIARAIEGEFERYGTKQITFS
ncbi:hypothetical protein JW826_01130 [Candidatus Woesearchaeota archaeon]|nr:hypothetical protein [Candidatus Woesearchaeota archaeon]